MDNTQHAATEPGPADRLALRDLVDAYARHVDQRDVEALALLFTVDARFTVDGALVSRRHDAGTGDSIVRNGRDEIAGAMVAGLGRYVATTHIIGGQVVTIEGDRATGHVVCLAHHVYDSDDGRRLLVMAVRYTDSYARQGGGWGFAERQLHLDWKEDRALEDRP